MTRSARVLLLVVAVCGCGLVGGLAYFAASGDPARDSTRRGHAVPDGPDREIPAPDSEEPERIERTGIGLIPGDVLRYSFEGTSTRTQRRRSRR